MLTVSVDVSKMAIWALIDEATELKKKRDELFLVHIAPLDEKIETIKQKILVEWRASPKEKKYFGTTFPEAHATVSQSNSVEFLIEAFVKDQFSVPEAKPEFLAPKVSLSVEDFLAKYSKTKVWKPSVRMYDKN